MGRRVSWTVRCMGLGVEWGCVVEDAGKVGCCCKSRLGRGGGSGWLLVAACLLACSPQTSQSPKGCIARAAAAAALSAPPAPCFEFDAPNLSQGARHPGRPNLSRVSGLCQTLKSGTCRRRQGGHDAPPCRHQRAVITPDTCVLPSPHKTMQPTWGPSTIQELRLQLALEARSLGRRPLVLAKAGAHDALLLGRGHEVSRVSVQQPADRAAA